MYSLTCIKRSPYKTKIKWPYQTGDPLKEVQFTWNFLWHDKKKGTFKLNTGNCMYRIDCTAVLFGFATGFVNYKKKVHSTRSRKW